VEQHVKAAGPWDELKVKASTALQIIADQRKMGRDKDQKWPISEALIVTDSKSKHTFIEYIQKVRKDSSRDQR
jgi:hypothetical protein